MKVSMLAGIAGLALCSGAFAQIQQAAPARATTPLAYAKATVRNGVVTKVGEWQSYGQGYGARGVGTLRFDTFGPDQSADSDSGRRPVTSATCQAAGLGDGYRWYFGPTANNSHFGHQYQFDDGTATGTATLSNLDVSWYMGAAFDGSGSRLPLVMGVFFYSDTPADPDAECVAPATDGIGYLFDFGMMASGGWYTNINGLEVDGTTISANGTYEVWLAESYNADTNEITPAGVTYPAQPFLYGTPDGRGEEGPGRQGINQMDDDAPLDGTFDTLNECYPYNYGLCPDPLSAALGVWTGDGAAPCLVDWNQDGFVDFFDYDDYVNCFETGTCVGHDTADYNGDGFVDFFDYDDFVNAFENGC